MRRLQPGDERAIEAFLARHADASLFLRSNLRAGGLVDHGDPFQATWAGGFEEGALVAVAAHAWNGNVVLQAPRGLAEVVRCSVATSGRPLRGIVGEWDQLVAAREALGVADRRARFTSRDDLLALDVSALVVPAALARGEVR
ncbi:MAG: GNAT family N-acetyltransferase, partial [Thermodesulfobacteriota bacterium]